MSLKNNRGYNPAIVPFLLQGLLLGLSAAASPGPFQAFLINQTLVGGFRRGAPIAFAPLLSDIPIVTVILLLLSQLPPSFLRFVSLAGGCFLVYLAWASWRQWRRNESGGDVPPAGGFWRGVLMNSLSPGPYTFWTLVNGPILLEAIRQSWFQGGAFLLGFYGTMITSLICISAVFHQVQRLGPRVVRYLTLGSILVMTVFGVVLLVQGIMNA